MHLIAKNLQYSYQEAGREHLVLKDINLELSDGERVALVGSSGSGKSTLLNVIGGIDRASSGSLELAEQSFGDMEEPGLTLFRRQQIGYIYQQFNLIPTLSVIENISLPLELAGLSVSEQRDSALAWLDKVGLRDRSGAFPDQLSGGEQQRVAIARALVHGPRLLLADEPTGNLDATTGDRVLSLLFDLTKEMKQTLLVVTHSRVVAERADRVLMLSEGELVPAKAGMAW